MSDPRRCTFELIADPDHWARWVAENLPGQVRHHPPVWPFLAAMPPVAPGEPIIVTIEDANVLYGIPPIDEEASREMIEIANWSDEEVDQYLREAGADPEEVGKRGAVFVQEVCRRIAAEKRADEADAALVNAGRLIGQLKAKLKTRKDQVLALSYGVSPERLATAQGFDLSDATTEDGDRPEDAEERRLSPSTQRRIRRGIRRFTDEDASLDEGLRSSLAAKDPAINHDPDAVRMHLENHPSPGEVPAFPDEADVSEGSPPCEVISRDPTAAYRAHKAACEQCGTLTSGPRCATGEALWQAMEIDEGGK